MYSGNKEENGVAIVDATDDDASINVLVTLTVIVRRIGRSLRSW